MRGGAGSAPSAAMTAVVLASTGLRFPIRIRLPCGNPVAREDHIVPVDDHRAPRRAEQT